MRRQKIDHDRLFKELIRTFFTEFLQLFLPQVAAYIEPGSVEFVDKEIFTDVTSGQRHEVDLVAKARFRGGRACLLVHIEAQGKPQKDFARRMFIYCVRLHELYDLPVYPIAVFSFDSPMRAEPAGYRMEFPDQVVVDFKFRSIQLNRLNWRDFLKQRNPVAAALMAKMRIAPQDRPRVKLECLRLLATLKLDRARMQLISGFVDSYLRLNAPEQKTFDESLAAVQPAEREVMFKFTTSWEEAGLKRGRQEGRAEMILQQLTKRFGPVPETMARRIGKLSAPKVTSLADALLDFKTLADAKAWLSRKR